MESAESSVSTILVFILYLCKPTETVQYNSVVGQTLFLSLRVALNWFCMVPVLSLALEVSY